MTYRENKVSERVEVAFSIEMTELRITQKILNDFLWSSEISYGYMLTEAPTAFSDLNKPAVDVLGHILTEAWYPTNQGQIKFRDTVGKILEQVASNTVHIYRAVLIFFASAFEHYLDKRLSPLRTNKEQGKWGPYLTKLAFPELLNSSTPVRSRTVLRADICRLLRNCMVHSSFHVPLNMNDHLISKWQASFKKNISQTMWPNVKDEHVTTAAFIRMRPRNHNA